MLIRIHRILPFFLLVLAAHLDLTTASLASNPGDDNVISCGADKGKTTACTARVSDREANTFRTMRMRLRLLIRDPSELEDDAPHRIRIEEGQSSTGEDLWSGSSGRGGWTNTDGGWADFGQRGVLRRGEAAQGMMRPRDQRRSRGRSNGGPFGRIRHIIKGEEEDSREAGPRLAVFDIWSDGI